MRRKNREARIAQRHDQPQGSIGRRVFGMINLRCFVAMVAIGNVEGAVIPGGTGDCFPRLSRYAPKRYPHTVQYRLKVGIPGHHRQKQLMEYATAISTHQQQGLEHRPGGLHESQTVFLGASMRSLMWFDPALRIRLYRHRSDDAGSHLCLPIRGLKLLSNDIDSGLAVLDQYTLAAP